LHGTGPIRLARPGWVDLAGLAVFAALVVEYARAFRVAPLNRYDAWAIWALKGHALYAFGWADPAVFAGTSYRFANLDYPLLLPKNEGSLVVFAVYLGLLVVARHHRRAVLTAAAVDVALLVPWRVYVAVHHIHDINYSFLNSFDYGHIHGRAGVGPIAFRTLGGQLIDPGQWGLLVPIAAAIVVVALLTGPRALPLFAAIWTIVSWLGLSWIYVIS